MKLWKRRPGNSPEGSSRIDPVQDRPTEPSKGHHHPQRAVEDWRPALEQKMKCLSYNFGASFSRPGDPQGIKMGEAYHDCAIGNKDIEDRAQIGKGYYMKAMSPGADFDASSIEAARKQRIQTLRETIARTEELDPVLQQANGNNTSAQMRKELREECQDELILLRNYVAPRRRLGQRITGMVEPVKLLTLRADSSLPERTTAETPNSLDPSRAEDTSPITAAKVWTVMRTGGEWPAPRAIMIDEEAQDNRRSSSFSSAGKLTELKKPGDADICESSDLERRDSALSGLDETQPEVIGEKDNAKSPATDERTPFPALIESFPPPWGHRRALPSEHTPEQKNAGGMKIERQGVLTDYAQREGARTEEAPLKAHVRCERAQQEDATSESMVLDPVEYKVPPAFTGKGKGPAKCTWPAKCTCPRCRSRRPWARERKRRIKMVGDTIMNKAEEEPGRSLDERMNMERVKEWREEAEKRGEGSSSWATRAGVASLEESMFTRPRPAPRVPVSAGQKESGEAAEEGRAPRKWVEEHHKADGGRLSVFPPAGGCNDMSTSMSMSMFHAIPRTEIKAVSREAASTMPPAQRGGRGGQVWETLSSPLKWWKSETNRHGSRD